MSPSISRQQTTRNYRYKKAIMEQLLIISVVTTTVFLLLKIKRLSKASHTPQHTRKTKTTTPAEVSPTPIQTRQSATPSLNTGIQEIDGPGMYQRLTGSGPQGHVRYLLHSQEHQAYKVGICRPERLGIRIRSIRNTVPDTTLVGTAVFTSHQNAFNAEQCILNENCQYRYRGITGEQSGSSEWIRRRPSSRRPSFTSPAVVEQRYQQQSEAPLEPLNIPDIYTIYLAYSETKNAYKAKWCKTENLHNKLSKLKEDASDTQVISRIRFARAGQAREITKQLNQDNGSFSQEGRRDIVHWSSNPSYLRTFRNWDAHGTRRQ